MEVVPRTKTVVTEEDGEKMSRGYEAADKHWQE
jgi:hypothetical protein